MDINWINDIETQISSLNSSLFLILPEAILFGTGLILLFSDKFNHAVQSTIFFAGILLSLFSIVIIPGPMDGFGEMIRYDGMSLWAKFLLFLSGGLFRWFEIHDRVSQTNSGTRLFLILCMISALSILSMAQNLVLLFIALEFVSLASYLLVAWRKKGERLTRSSLTYILFGMFSSALTIYGISWLYGLTGTFQFTTEAFQAGLTGANPTLLLVSFFLAIGGIFFKLSVTPFHFWVADVYEGIRYPLAAFFSIAPKIGAAVVLIRLLHSLSPTPAFELVQWVLLMIAAITMTWGNLGAFWQASVKRILAFSGIAHAGYMILALVWSSDMGIAALLFYLGIYLLMNTGAFVGSAFFLGEKDQLASLSGLGIRQPFQGVLLGICMVSLAGLPPTAGFIAKWNIFSASLEQITVENQSILIAVLSIAVINTVISLFYYIKPVIWLFFRKVSEPEPFSTVGYLSILLLFMTVPVMIFGVYGFDRIMNFLLEILWN